MRHRKNTIKLNRTSSHRRCLFANMLKSLIFYGRIETTLPKARFLKRYADKMVTLAKKNTLSSRRQAIADMMITFNPLSSSEARAVKKGDKTSYNTDRQVIEILFNELGPRFKSREGGYTRVLKTGYRQGDSAPTCLIEYLAD